MSENFIIRCGDTNAVVSSRGGTVISFEVNGKEILYPLQEVGDKSRGGCFVCAPWFGSSPRGPKKHGYLRDTEANEILPADYCVDLTFDHPGTDGFPWHMWYRHLVSVGEGYLKLELWMRMIKGSTEAAPVLPAFHPYFACDNLLDVRVEAGPAEYRFTDDKDPMIFPLYKRYDVNVKMPNQKISMHLRGDYSPESYLVLWSDSLQYVCVEPISRDKRLFDTPRGYYLESGHTLYLATQMFVGIRI